MRGTSGAMASSLRQRIKSSLPASVLGTLLLLKHSRELLPNRRIYEPFVRGKRGLEIGGPSGVFRSALPLYSKAGSVDGVNFSCNTVWEGSVRPGRTFGYFPGRTGIQLVSEATELSAIGCGAYDFVLSSNCLEHVANPLKALFEWKRVMRPGGALVLVLPNKASNFDHRRPFTSFEHLLNDYERGTTENDLTHLDEILALHDLSMDPPAGSFEAFKARSLENFDNRTLHHHVFEPGTIEKMLRHAGLSVLATTETSSDFFSLAAKS
jgi:SAM-dependent methyltransferase